MRRFNGGTWVSALVLCCCGLGCSSGTVGEVLPIDSDSIATPKSTTSPEASELKPKPEQIVVSNVPLLAHGTHMVFGIRMPKGMLPMTRSDNVQRFEGTHSIDAVKKYLMEQLVGNVQIKDTQFGNGYIISSAIPKSSQANLAKIDTSGKKYNIKIFEGSLGGAGVDLWEAKPGEQYVEQETGQAGSAFQNLTGLTLLQKRAAASSKIKYKSKPQREKAVFRTFDKLATGQPLTEEDYQSPYFTDM